MTDTQPEPGPETPRRRPGPGELLRRSARLRIVAVQLAVVALAIGASLLIAREFLISRLDSDIDRELLQESEELRSLANLGVDPLTGGAFTDPRRLMRVNLQRNLNDRNETMLSIVNGVADSRSAQTPPVRLDLDPAYIARFDAVTEPTLADLETSLGRVRYLATPVRVRGSEDRGVFVVAIFRDLERSDVNDLQRVLALSGAIGLLLAAIAAWIVAGRVLAPVRQVRRTADSIRATDLTQRIDVKGADEVAELARTFNQMLDRLEDAFRTQQEFVDDAGHELRTPLTIIRGHLETMGDDPAVRARAMAVVYDELDRMARMVDDLLTLAKARRPDFLILRQVELSELTMGVVERCQGLSADREWRCDEFGAGWFVADDQRLTQAVLQLAANAVQHTASGGTIRIGSRMNGQSVELWVHDDGPGVAEDDRDRIFDRFTRSGDNRRNANGAGLGLAIVDGIASAHGGAVHLDRTSEGACFRIAFPLVEGE